jgi:hypothetical protein
MTGGTLTVSKVEQLAVLLVLSDERGKLTFDDLDGLLLDDVCKRLRLSTTVQLSRIEVTAMVRHLRCQREHMAIALRALEERRLRGGYNGHLNDAQVVLDGQCSVLDDVLRRLWQLI